MCYSKCNKMISFSIVWFSTQTSHSLISHGHHQSGISPTGHNEKYIKVRALCLYKPDLFSFSLLFAMISSETIINCFKRCDRTFKVYKCTTVFLHTINFSDLLITVSNKSDGQKRTTRVFYLLSGVSISFLLSVVCGDPASMLSMRLSTLEIRNSFISVFLFINSILKNIATISNIEIKDRSEEPLWRTSAHLEVFLLGSMISCLNKLDCLVN